MPPLLLFWEKGTGDEGEKPRDKHKLTYLRTTELR
jgi:hypothetical protein